MKEYGRGTYTHFKHACKKKQNLKAVLDDVIPALTDIDDIDKLPVPKWTKKHFKSYYRYNMLGHLTPQQIAELMDAAAPAEEEIYPVAKYIGVNNITVGKVPIEIEPNDIISFVDDSHISVNHHPVTIKLGDVQLINPILMLGHYSYDQKIEIVSKGLESKYGNNVPVMGESQPSYRDSIRITRF